MQGNLQQIQLPEVLQFISMGKSTGTLTVRDSDGLETVLMIRRGKIINSSALDRQRRLGELLVHRGILKRSVLSQLLNMQRTVDKGKRLGELLLEREIVQESTLREVLRLQLEEEIWNLFGMEAGEFKFEQGEENKMGEAAVQIDIEPLLLEGTRRQDEWRKILKLLPTDKLIIGITPVKSSEEIDNIRLTPTEWRVLAHINGHTSIRGIVNRSGLGRFEVYRVVYDFLHRRIAFVKEVQVDAEEEMGGADEGLSSVEATQLASRGMGGLLSRLTGSGRRDYGAGKLQFVSPVGALCHFANRMLDQANGLKDLRSNPEDARLMYSLWDDLLVNYTKADLILVRRGHLNSDELETFLKLFEFSSAVQDVYEDCIEALLQLTDTLYRVLCSRIGERQMNRVVRELIDELPGRISLMYAPEFDLGERLRSILQVAA